MIGKAKACKGGAILANYVMKPEKGYELMRNWVSGDTSTEILQEMRVIQDLNQRAVNKTFSMVLSPDRKEGWKLSDNKLRAMTREFMAELGVDPEEQQFVAFIHTEDAHKHIHIIANRVTWDGKLLSDHKIGKRAQWVAHRVAKKHGLISAKETQINNLKNKDQESNEIKLLKKEMKRKHDWVMKQNIKSVRGYIMLMQKLNIEVVPVFNKYSKKLQGLRMRDLESGLDFKASDVHRSMSLNKIMKTGIPFENPKEMETETVGKSQGFIPSLNLGGMASAEESGIPKKRKRKNKDEHELER